MAFILDVTRRISRFRFDWYKCAGDRPEPDSHSARPVGGYLRIRDGSRVLVQTQSRSSYLPARYLRCFLPGHCIAWWAWILAQPPPNPVSALCPRSNATDRRLDQAKRDSCL